MTVSERPEHTLSVCSLFFPLCSIAGVCGRSRSGFRVCTSGRGGPTIAFVPQQLRLVVLVMRDAECSYGKLWCSLACFVRLTVVLIHEIPAHRH
jgi:hypothetical protein